MDKMLFKKAQHIISPYLNKETRVMDLFCGEDCYTRWIKSEKNALLVPLSPSDMEHISHENPFVAYNNFINDERKIPTDNSKADVVLLLGPLYDKQSEENKRETLKEIKRLISQDGKVMTLRTGDKGTRNVPSPLKQEEENLGDAGFTVKEQQSLEENKEPATENSPYSGSEYYLTVATPKPVISCDALPPQVYVRTPVDVIQKYNIAVLDNRKNSEENEKIEKNSSDSKQSKDGNDNRCNNEVKPSINPALQRRAVVKNSIDNTLFVKKTSKEDKVISIDLPILPKEITDQYNNSPKENTSENANEGIENNNSELEIKDSKNNISKEEIKNIDSKENNSIEELSEKNLEDIPPRPAIPIKASIDKNLYVRKKNMDSGKVIDADMDYTKVQFSIDKSLQMRIPKIDPKYAKPKSRKKCIRNVLR
ncbi:MAG: hypothetical protein ACI4RL_07410 [Ruminococcus sp.]